MNPINTTSGKTAKANIERLRQRRVPVPVDYTDALVDQLDALSEQAFVVIRSVREPINVLLRLTVQAKQTVRKLRKVDVEV